MASSEATSLLAVQDEQEEDCAAQVIKTWTPRRVAGAAVGVVLGLVGAVAVAQGPAQRPPSQEPMASTHGGSGVIAEFAAFECTGASADLRPGLGDVYNWRCFGGACIPAAGRCDGTPQCMDSSDEQYCPNSPASAVPGPAPAVPGYPAPAPAPAPGYPAPVPAPQPAESGGCFNHQGYNDYSLNWKAEGSSFFGEWEYQQSEPNSGGAEYVTAEEGYNLGLTQAFPDKAILKAGAKGSYLKRKSFKVVSRRKWKYMLMAMKYEAIPWGCGVWPSFWLKSPDAAWPAGGEFDILEYSNELQSRTSLHTAPSNRCQLNGALLNKPGCPQFLDSEYEFTGHYDCVTDYPDHIGCAPNDRTKMLNGQQLSQTPGVLAVEWTPDYLKVFRIPNNEMPADLTSDAPRPDGWDQWIVAYYPFAESERTIPGSCPNPANILMAQQIVINLGFCGDWSAKVYSNSTCKNAGYPSQDPWTAKGPVINSQCVAVDPHDPKGQQPAGPMDCCTQFIYDKDGTFGTDQYLAEHGNFAINWIKVFQSAQASR